MTKQQIIKVITDKIQKCIKDKRYSNIGIYNNLLIVISYKGSTMSLKSYNKYFSLLFEVKLFNDIKEYLLKNNLLRG